MGKEHPNQAGSLSEQYRWLLLSGISFILLFVIFNNADAFINRMNSLFRPNSQLSWPTVQATILSSDLLCRQRSNGEGEWMFDVRFQYQVQGSRYSAQQRLDWSEVLIPSPDEHFDISDPEIKPFFQGCGEVFGGRPDPVAVMDRLKFSPGQQVLVYFNPSGPDDAVIVPGVLPYFGTNGSYGEIIFVYGTLILCFGGVAMLIAGIRNLRK